MKLRILEPKDSLPDTLKKHRINPDDFEKFKENLHRLLSQTDRGKFEEFNKNTLIRFLDNAFYFPNHYINIKGRNDLVIHHGKDADSKVSVIIEAKRPEEKRDMLSRDNVNVKALHELILYYLRERITSENNKITHLIATDFYQWFLFDAQVFEKLFFKNTKFRNDFNDFEAGRLSSRDTKLFYEEIAAPYVDSLTQEIKFTYFDLRDCKDSLSGVDPEGETNLITLYKTLSPEHLLKKNVPNDSNALNKDFYVELLHIIGLKQVAKGGKKLIQRKEAGERNRGALLENAIDQLELSDRINHLPDPEKYGKSGDERLFNVGLELCITWINRILFLKLMEAQLVKYHGNDKSLEFLRIDKIPYFGVLNRLFFKVLALKNQDRDESLQKAFGHVPYLNSSLFEVSDVERNFILISSLSNDRSMPLHPKTVLRDESDKVPQGEMGTLKYLLEFLRAYDFSSEGSEEFQEKDKGLISASVLGLIFEKINGYKDGSYFTPGFITEYMCRETIKRAILQKFKEAKGWDYDNLTDLHNKIEPADIKEANKIVNSLKVCDPAVGSGHFLVSALNEIIAVKQQLGILTYRDGKKIKIEDYEIRVVDDELMITDDDGKRFKYERNNRKSQRLQEALFHEKQTIIENCLFGVDINPNSVNICRLRLWIELLKNAYYKEDTGFKELETLPNIDINIKCGNSLVSRFKIDDNLRQIARNAKWSISSYQTAVEAYKRSHEKEDKQALEELINSIKSNYVDTIEGQSETLQEYYKLKREYDYKFPERGLFANESDETRGENADKLEREKQRLKSALDEKEKEIEDQKRFFETHNAFEWRFEFPEVLNDDGDFIGFDMVIGNPPYGSLFSKTEKAVIKRDYQFCDYQFDIYMTFFERSYNLLKHRSHICFIVPNTWLLNLKTPNIRKLLFDNFSTHTIRAYKYPVFQEAVVDTVIVSAEKSRESSGLMSVQIINRKEEIFINHFSKKELSTNYHNHVNIYLTRLASSIQLKLSSLPKLDDIAKITQGAKPFQKGKGNPKQDAQILRNKPFVKAYKKNDSFRPLLRGSLINRYAITWDNDYYISLGDWLAEPRYSANYDAPVKIVIRQTGSSLIATIDSQQFVLRDNLYSIISKNKNYSEYVLLACLNSKLLNWYYQNIVNNEVGEALAQVKRGHLAILPIPNFNEVTFITIKSLVIQVLAKKRADVSSETSSLENQIDQLVYQLYDLTDEEIQIIENS